MEMNQVSDPENYARGTQIRVFLVIFWGLQFNILPLLRSEALLHKRGKHQRRR